MKPNPPLNVTVVSKSSQVVNISWIAGFNGNSAIQNYKVEIEGSEDNLELVDAVCQGSLSDSSCVVSSTSASFANLTPWTTYSFKVFATNAVGTSNGSSVVNVTTDEEGAVCKQCGFFQHSFNIKQILYMYRINYKALRCWLLDVQMMRWINFSYSTDY